MLTLLDKLRVIEATGVLGVDLSWLNGNYQQALFHHLRKSPVIRLRELAEPRRRAELVCFLWQSYSDAVDQAVDMFDKLLTRAHTQAQKELDEQLCRPRQTIQLSLTALRSIGRIILDDAISDEELRARLFAAVPREELVACVDEIGEWVTGKRSDLFHGIVRRHGMLRKFSPALLDALELTQDIEGEQSACLLIGGPGSAPCYSSCATSLRPAISRSATANGSRGWRWHLSAEPTEKLDQEGQDRLAHLKSWLAKHMRRVKLPDLLIEVDNQLGFTQNFLYDLSATITAFKSWIPWRVCLRFKCSRQRT